MPIPKILEDKIAALGEAYRKAENARENVQAVLAAWGPVPTDVQFAAADGATEAEMYANTILRVQVAALLAAYGESLEAEEKAAAQMDQTLRSLA